MIVAVADTSALIRLYIPDGPVVEGVEAAVDAAWRGEGLLLCPELALAEMTQVVWKKEIAGHLSSGEADELFEAFLELPLHPVRHGDLLAPARTVARRHGLSIYDGLFLALAIRHRCPLLTADQTLAQAAQKET
ncbi:MAG: PIN domain-containing protein, partial [Nitrospirae bacterium]